MLAIKFKPLSNNLKKFIISLKDKKKRKELGLFIAEGYKICEELYQSNYPTEFVVIEGSAKEATRELAKKFYSRGVEVYSARRQQFIQLCETETPQDIIAIAKTEHSQHEVEFPIIILDGISDPGNFGTIIRTCDWFGITTIVTSEDSVEKYNPKVIRGSMGSFFRVNILQKENISKFLERYKRNSKIFAATLNAETNLSNIKFPENSIIIFGNESRGISPSILELAHEKFKIEGKERTDSLNLAISVGIVLYKFFVNAK
ncbi:MAG: RNA methyltransferase [Ignavibacteria bacterium]|nr:RNA methyltransferase [Ignavibacteria bacterium]